MIPLSITDFLSSLTGGQIAGWGLAALIALLSIIQISPLKLNPWDSIFAWMGKKLNGKQLDGLQKQVTTMWVNDHRHRILTFARECRASIDHSSDEWSNALCIADETRSTARRTTSPTASLRVTRSSSAACTRS